MDNGDIEDGKRVSGERNFLVEMSGDRWYSEE